MTTCPVCGRQVDAETAPSSVFRDVVYYFACAHCKEAFDRDPEQFVGAGVAWRE